MRVDEQIVSYSWLINQPRFSQGFLKRRIYSAAPFVPSPLVRLGIPPSRLTAATEGKKVLDWGLAGQRRGRDAPRYSSPGGTPRGMPPFYTCRVAKRPTTYFVLHRALTFKTENPSPARQPLRYGDRPRLTPAVPTALMFATEVSCDRQVSRITGHAPPMTPS